MPKRIYVGSHDAVVLMTEGTPIEVRHGEAIEVSKETAQEMDVSAAWETPKDKGVSHAA